MHLDLTAIVDSRISDVEVIDITGTGNNTLTLALADVLAISSTSDQLRIEGNAGDVVNIIGVWADQGMAGGYQQYGSGLATLLVDAEISRNLII